jgi:hypothetical protein
MSKPTNEEVFYPGDERSDLGWQEGGEELSLEEKAILLKTFIADPDADFGAESVEAIVKNWANLTDEEQSDMYTSARGGKIKKQLSPAATDIYLDSLRERVKDAIKEMNPQM